MWVAGRTVGLPFSPLLFIVAFFPEQWKRAKCHVDTSAEDVCVCWLALVWNGKMTKRVRESEEKREWEWECVRARGRRRGVGVFSSFSRVSV